MSWPLHVILLADSSYSPSHILLGTLYIPRIFSEYSHRKPSAHPRGAEKWSFRGRKGVSECVFARPFREKPLSHAKPTVNTADQLFRHHKHEVKPPNRRNMWEIAVRNPRNGRNMWIFPIWNIGKMRNTLYIPRNIPEHEVVKHLLYSERNSGITYKG